MDDVQRLARWAMREMRVMQRIGDLHRRVNGDLNRQPSLASILALHAIENGAQILAVDVLHRDEEVLVFPREIEDRHDIGVLELHRDLRLIDEHRDELLVLRDARQNALHRDESLEPFNAKGLGFENFGHPADVDAFEK